MHRELGPGRLPESVRSDTREWHAQSGGRAARQRSRNAAIGSCGGGRLGAAGRTTGGRLVSATGWSPASAIAELRGAGPKRSQPGRGGPEAGQRRAEPAERARRRGRRRVRLARIGARLAGWPRRVVIGILLVAAAVLALRPDQRAGAGRCGRGDRAGRRGRPGPGRRDGAGGGRPADRADAGSAVPAGVVVRGRPG